MWRMGFFARDTPLSMDSLIQCAGLTHASGGLRPSAPPNIEIRIESPFDGGRWGNPPCNQYQNWVSCTRYSAVSGLSHRMRRVNKCFRWASPGVIRIESTFDGGGGGVPPCTPTMDSNPPGGGGGTPHAINTGKKLMGFFEREKIYSDVGGDFSDRQ